MCMCNGTVYIFVGAIGGWKPMDSGLANRHIRAISGSMASVNTAVAAEPVKEMLLGSEIPRIRLPMSLCISGGRYGLTVREAIEGDPVYDPSVGGVMTVVVRESPLTLLECLSGDCTKDPSINVCVLQCFVMLSNPSNGPRANKTQQKPDPVPLCAPIKISYARGFPMLLAPLLDAPPETALCFGQPNLKAQYGFPLSPKTSRNKLPISDFGLRKRSGNGPRGRQEKTRKTSTPPPPPSPQKQINP